MHCITLVGYWYRSTQILTYQWHYIFKTFSLPFEGSKFILTVSIRSIRYLATVKRETFLALDLLIPPHRQTK